MNILVVDDEKDMILLLTSYLKAHDYAVYPAGNGREALEVLRQEPIDLVLLDIMMPVMDGLETAKEIRTFSNVPIIMLTAKGNEDDRVTGLKTGADDYVVKPFSPKELVARIEAALRRSIGYKNPSTDSRTIIHEGLSVDLKGHVVKVDGTAVNLTRKEFLLLSLLVQNRGQVFSREQLLDKVWGFESEGTPRTVDTHIKTLRLKLKTAGPYIATVWGVGYKFI
ncbi:response regulator transcription factor [Rossellomorea vietnamensis]|uniref:Response regulator transcription factor n=1 Tax=Rossellomorea vietnamensis TaxID=218284 RepID=A0A5D4M8N8_9BACI|nr:MULTISPECIES: response regulator transcription factor [Bacillaceae]TYR97405.1 response regulator transcription factor [Rossellomorea vietnamensis]